MKKTLLLLIALITATIAFAQTEINGIYYNLNDETQTAEVTYSSNKYSGNITIPEKVTYNSTEYCVTSIGEGAFYNCSSLISISIPNSVTSIGRQAFYNCSSLTSISIPNSVTSIGSSAFSNCSSLTSITIPNSVTSIGGYAFHSTPWLNNQPDGCLYIGKCLYAYKGEMPENTHIDVKEGTSMICDVAFSSCSSLTSITIPNSVTSIRSSAFYSCLNIAEIHISDIAKWCDIDFETSVSNPLYNKNACLYVSGNKITELVIPEGVDSIKNYAFYYYAQLTSVTIPNSVTSIGDEAFYRCSSLTSITIPNSVTSIGYEAFYGTSWLSNQPDGCIYINNCLHTYKGEMPENTHIDVKEGTTMIHDYAFQSCSSLTSITIPNSVTSIGEFTFYNCSSLTSISIPNSVTSIGNYVFYNCDSLRSITIPNSVTSIGNSAFSGCSNIAEIHISDIAKWCDIDFKGSESNPLNKNACLYVSGNKITELVIPEGVDSIKNYAFYSYAQLTSVTIPNSVTSIGNSVFQYCSSLTSITIPNSVTSIGERAFQSCSSLTSITIPNSVTSIGGAAFSECSSLTSITIPNSVTSIVGWAFSYCSSLTSITIPNSVTSIGNYAFHGCSSLTSITCLGSTPPEASDLGANTSTCTLTVPKEAYSSYLRHAYWGQFLTIRTIGDKEIKTAVNNSAWGKVTGAGVYNENDEATLTATANSGYRFVKWSDEVTDNPRTVIVTQDSTFTAIFETNTFAITTSVNDDTMGSVTEGGEYAHGSEITLTATANSGYRFAQWSDGNTDNPRTITVTENKTYTAEFEVEVFGVYAAAAVPSMGGVEVILNAKPIEGLVFDHWSDGNTENPRTLTLTEDIELYAYFKVAEATNLETSKISSANIYTTNGTLHIEGATENYHILDAAGRLIYSGNASTLQLPRGIYLVTMGGEVEKIVL